MKLAAVGTIHILSATPGPGETDTLEKGVALPVLITGELGYLFENKTKQKKTLPSPQTKDSELILIYYYVII